MKMRNLIQFVVIVWVFIGTANVNAELPRSMVRYKTIQNLSTTGVYFGQHLAVDEKSGNLTLSRESHIGASNTYWELKRVLAERGYRTTHVIINRGYSPLNGYHLSVDEVAGVFKHGRKVVPTSSWLIRYAGLYNGYCSFYIQTVAHTARGFDMAFLSIDDRTGEVILTKKPLPGSRWFINNIDDMPTEVIK